MLAQFQSLYPQGSLISELVQIYHGSYIVRASVQIEGVTRATGMAAAETLEEAEDRARTRALMILGITGTSQASPAFSSEPTEIVKPNPTLVTTSALSEPSVYSPAINSSPQTEVIAFTPKSDANSQDLGQRFPVVSKQSAELDTPMSIEIVSDTFAIRSSPQTEVTAFTPTSDTDSQDLSQRFPVISKQSDELDTPMSMEIVSDTLSEENNFLPRGYISNVTPFVPRSYNPPEDVQTQDLTFKKKKKSQPVDLSDVIAKTDVHIERLGWSKEQGKDHLKKTYNKLGRTLLTEDELLDFLNYLESQPSPLDPEAGF